MLFSIINATHLREFRFIALYWKNYTISNYEKQFALRLLLLVGFAMALLHKREFKGKLHKKPAELKKDKIIHVILLKKYSIK